MSQCQASQKEVAHPKKAEIKIKISGSLGGDDSA